jgi:hypothetical protein
MLDKESGNVLEFDRVKPEPDFPESITPVSLVRQADGLGGGNPSPIGSGSTAVGQLAETASQAEAAAERIAGKAPVA